MSKLKKLKDKKKNKVVEMPKKKAAPVVAAKKEVEKPKAAAPKSTETRFYTTVAEFDKFKSEMTTSIVQTLNEMAEEINKLRTLTDTQNAAGVIAPYFVASNNMTLAEVIICLEHNLIDKDKAQELLFFVEPTYTEEVIDEAENSEALQDGIHTNDKLKPYSIEKEGDVFYIQDIDGVRVGTSEGKDAEFASFDEANSAIDDLKGQDA